MLKLKVTEGITLTLIQSNEFRTVDIRIEDHVHETAMIIPYYTTRVLARYLLEAYKIAQRIRDGQLTNHSEFMPRDEDY